ncbi:MAG: sugar phosphate isomerase/epimerase [Liquorilactobacillus nagelii]|uniref:sugar phosphate isomerase/epimerase family protein n=1 Tax=Liquorilactobacillus nagelii TaxID=82688 RepID=UPI0039E73F59
MSRKIPITVSSWTLGDACSFESRCRAAHLAGYDGIGLRAETYVDALNEGLSNQQILSILEQYQLKCTEVEYIVQWCEDKRSYEQQYKEQICFQMCDFFGVKHINTGLLENYSVEKTAKKLQKLCQRAGNLQIALEPMPYSGLPDLKKTWQVIQAAGCENAKMLLDVWHWVRSKQSFDLLTKEQAAKVISIQLDDVYQRPYAASVLRAESMHDRLVPGAGAAQAVKFVEMIKHAGVKPQVIGVEVISDESLAHGIEWTATQTFKHTYQVLQSAWPEILQ